MKIRPNGGFFIFQLQQPSFCEEDNQRRHRLGGSNDSNPTRGNFRKIKINVKIKIKIKIKIRRFFVKVRIFFVFFRKTFQKVFFSLLNFFADEEEKLQKNRFLNFQQSCLSSIKRAVC